MLEGGGIRPTIRVYVSIYDASVEDPFVQEEVLIDARSGDILARTSTAEKQASGYEYGAPGFPSALIFLEHPPLSNATDPVAFATSLREVGLHHIIPETVTTDSPTGPVEFEYALSNGYFIGVHNQRQADWRRPGLSPSFLIDAPVHSMLLDSNYGDADEPTSCIGFAGNDPRPDSVEEENRFWESRLGEVSAYYNLDYAAAWYFDRFDYKLHRSSRADPQIQVWTHTNTQEAPAWFSSRTQYDGAHPLIVFNKGWCWDIIAGGNDLAWVDGRTYDFYSMRDVSRDRDVAMHEFTHAIQWDIVPFTVPPIVDIPLITEEAGHYTRPFQEGIADFFALSSRYEGPSPDRPVFSPWYSRTDLDPVNLLTGEEIDIATPYHQRQSSEEHFVGEIWSNFLWDVRDRLVLFETEWGPNARSVQHSVEDLQFEALFRMDKEVDSFREALRDLLAADSEKNGKRASYELITSAARHGIKLDRFIAAAEPNHFIMGPDINGLDLAFDVYTGASETFTLEVASDPALIGPDPEGQNDPRQWRFVCTQTSCAQPGDPTPIPGALEPIPGSIDPATGAPIDRENLHRRIRIPPGQFQFFSTKNPVFLYFEVSYGLGNDARSSTIPGAGATSSHPDLPAVLFVPTGPGPAACQCSFAAEGRSPSSLGAVLFITALAIAWRRRNS